jgi:hypothetical protein
MESWSTGNNISEKVLCLWKNVSSGWANFLTPRTENMIAEPLESDCNSFNISRQLNLHPPEVLRGHLRIRGANRPTGLEK